MIHTTMTTKDGIEIDLTDIEQRHDSGWAEWNCTCTFPNGTELPDCSVQSDGHTFARETLTDNLGNPIPTQ